MRDADAGYDIAQRGIEVRVDLDERLEDMV